MNRLIPISLLLLLVFSFTQCEQDSGVPSPIQGTVKVSFKNTVNGNPLVLTTGNYTNQNGQAYTVSKFKYYISNIKLSNINKQFAEPESYHLVDQANAASQSFTFNANAEVYSHITFTIGVDSLRNVSGAQTGALDPLNDMFWTWSTGYIMAKLEGNSPASTVVNNKLEYHIGGFSGAFNSLRTITLTIPATTSLLNIKYNKTSEVVIEANIDKWFSNNVNFTTEAAIMTPGVLSKKIADNYQSMFSITQVINN
jgi:hypothetical protein